MKYLSVYKEWAKATEQTTYMYLCNYFTYGDYFLSLVTPTDSDEKELQDDGLPTYAWGKGNSRKRFSDYKPGQPFTPLRRNLLLLMAAMNEEL